MIARLCFVFTVGLACAQSTAPLEIRGTVVEGALGIGGVAVTLYEFGHTPAEATTRTVFATTSTDAKGAFVFHPARAGDYYVEVQKEGYFAESFDGPTVDPVDSVGDPVRIDGDHPSQERQFTLMRLGELRGRVIDEDGKPVAELRVGLRPATSTPVITDQDGYFVATELRPGNYVVLIGPQHGLAEILPQFSVDDLKTVDQDFEAASWPSAPVPISSGASLSVGTIRTRKVFYARAHLTVQSGDCTAGEKWAFMVIPASDKSGSAFPRQVTCANEFLVRNLIPGSYSFLVSSGPLGATKKWAITSAEVTDKDLDIALNMAPVVDIPGRLIAAEGAAPPPGKIMIAVAPVIAQPTGVPRAVVDSAGDFVIRGVPGNRHRVSVNGLGSNFYVKEIRYDGLFTLDGIITPVSGSAAPLEIVIDDRAAAITGSVALEGNQPGRIRIVALKGIVSTEYSPLLMLNANPSATADDQGRFQIGGLAPGDYRLLVLTVDSLIRSQPDRLNQLLNLAEKVTLERGSSKTVSLKIIEP